MQTFVLPGYRSLRRVAIGLLCAAALGGAFAPEARAQASAEDVERCLRQNLPKRSSVQTMRFDTRDRMGNTRRIEGKIFWRRGESDAHSKTLVRIEAPPELRGSSYLLLEKPDVLDIFVYLPEFQKVRRITPHALAGSLFGTDFSYEDMMRLRHVFERQRAERLADERVGERDAFVVQLVPPPESGSAYERVKAWVDQKSCVPLRMEFVAKGGSLAKELTSDPATFSQRGSIWVASAFVLRDLHEQTETALELGEIEADVDLPDRLFSERALAQGN
ncbi:MAG: outer membrane lipoprotein-sorting protein [Myxococcota bacterium]|nr:outer membrane lipoprotein-sorting protein [Myxococcota bacterium]